MKLIKLPIGQIKHNPHQPRVSFDENALDELAASIASVGLLHPPLVHQRSVDDYVLIAGERRLQACKRLGLASIDAWVIESSNDRHRAEAALVENLQRVDLNAMEIAQSLDRLRLEFEYSHEKIALAIGKKRSTVSNYLRLLQLERPLQDALRNHLISFGHAKLLASQSPKVQANFLKKILTNGWSVHELEKQMQIMASPVVKMKQTTSVKEWEELREAIVKRYGLKAEVHLRKQKNQLQPISGYIKLHFSKLEDLHRLAYGYDL